MKALCAWGLAVALTTLAACGTEDLHYLARAKPIWTDTVFVHKPSGMVFPTKVGAFGRVLLLQYDEAGFDVSAGYDFRAAADGIAASVHVYPAPARTAFASPDNIAGNARDNLCRQDFARREQELRRAHPDAHKTAEQDLPQSPADQFRLGLMASFDYDQLFFGTAPGPVRSDLYLFCNVDGRWAFEYRFTAPRGFDAAGRVADFMTKLPPSLPGRL